MVEADRAVDGEARLRLRLYVAGEAPNSEAARQQLRRTLETAGWAEACSLEIVDVLEEPARAARDGVLVTPTLARLDGDGPRRMVGSLRDREMLMRFLGIEGFDSESEL